MDNKITSVSYLRNIKMKRKQQEINEKTEVTKDIKDSVDKILIEIDNIFGEI